MLFRAFREREGAFERYNEVDVELSDLVYCGGCPGPNIEEASAVRKENGWNTIHLSTDFLTGYPPCPYVKYFKKYLREKFKLNVVVGTHPIPQKDWNLHHKLDSWEDPKWDPLLSATLCAKRIRLKYDK